MENYASTIEQILKLKQESKGDHFIPNFAEQHHNSRIQPTDIQIVLRVIGQHGSSKFEFAAELYCRTLLAQITHSGSRKFFEDIGYEEVASAKRFNFVETIGWCPGRCRRHIHPLVLPLLILYWKPEAKYAFHGSDNPSDDEAQRTLSVYFQSLARYKSSFVERVPALFDYLLKASTPSTVKSKIVDDFVNFPIGLSEQVAEFRWGRGTRIGFPHETPSPD